MLKNIKRKLSKQNLMDYNDQESEDDDNDAIIDYIKNNFPKAQKASNLTSYIVLFAALNPNSIVCKLGSQLRLRMAIRFLSTFPAASPIPSLITQIMMRK